MNGAWIAALTAFLLWGMLMLTDSFMLPLSDDVVVIHSGVEQP